MYPEKQRRNLLASLCIIFMRINITWSTKPGILHGSGMVKFLNREEKGGRINLKMWTILQWQWHSELMNKWIQLSLNFLGKRIDFLRRENGIAFPGRTPLVPVCLCLVDT